MGNRVIKTIAVYLPTAGLTDRLLDVAIPLAEAHGATLVGIHAMPAVVVYADATVSMSTEFIAAQQEAFQEDLKAVESKFRARVERTKVANEWSNADIGDEPTMRAVSAFSNAADLVIASQHHESIPAASGYSPDELVLGTGRPVLVVPAAGDLGGIGKRVVVAWNGSREAARACFDCLPLLQPSGELRLLVVGSTRGNATLSALTRALQRHGVKPMPFSASKSEGRTSAEEILGHAGEFGADLLVLGCYGHSRLRETVFGGVTSHILSNMTTPVLMAH
jgi:nucleotide-binding universal stress UspA family protein